MISNLECVFEVTYKTSNSDQLQAEQFRLDELVELKRFFKRHKHATLHVLNDNNRVINAAANTAFKYGVHLVVNQRRYRFNDDNTHLNNRQITIELIKQAKDFVFFKAVQSKLINTMLLESPLYYSEQQAIDSVKSIFQIDNYISHEEMGQRINKKENTHLLEKILKNRENCIETDEKTYLKYVDTNNLNFSKVIFSYAIFNKDLYYLKLMYKADKIAFIEFCNSKTVLQKAVNNIESKNNYINNEIFKLNNSFYKQILNYVKKDYNQSFYNDIKSKININLMKLNMDAF